MYEATSDLDEFTDSIIRGELLRIINLQLPLTWNYPQYGDVILF